jgi:hypothetical protein
LDIANGLSSIGKDGSVGREGVIEELGPVNVEGEGNDGSVDVVVCECKKSHCSFLGQIPSLSKGNDRRASHDRRDEENENEPH